MHDRSFGCVCVCALESKKQKKYWCAHGKRSVKSFLRNAWWLDNMWISAKWTKPTKKNCAHFLRALFIFSRCARDSFYSSFFGYFHIFRPNHLCDSSNDSSNSWIHFITHTQLIWWSELPQSKLIPMKLLADLCTCARVSALAWQWENNFNLRYVTLLEFNLDREPNALAHVFLSHSSRKWKWCNDKWSRY